MLNSLAKIIFSTLVVLGAVSCMTSRTLDNPVTWYAVNTGSNITIEVYDQVCGSMMRNIHLIASRETSITTCGGEDGAANFRFRHDSYSPRSPGWTRKEGVIEGERVLVQ